MASYRSDIYRLRDMLCAEEVAHALERNARSLEVNELKKAHAARYELLEAKAARLELALGAFRSRGEAKEGRWRLRCSDGALLESAAGSTWTWSRQESEAQASSSQVCSKPGKFFKLTLSRRFRRLLASTFSTFRPRSSLSSLLSVMPRARWPSPAPRSELCSSSPAISTPTSTSLRSRRSKNSFAHA